MNEAAEIIKKFEGFRAKAYRCPAGKLTIGYGTTIYPQGEAIKEGDSMNEAFALKLLNTDLDKIYKYLETLNLNDNQTQALASLIYNVGIGNFMKSEILKKIKINPNDHSIEAEFLNWNKAGGKVLNGLTKRRIAEVQLYFS